MAHLLRTWKDEVLVEGFNPTGADLIDIDEKTKVAINGDAGGTWLPSAQITIGGKGFVFAAPSTISGGNANATGAITFGRLTSDDCFKLDAGHPETTVDVPQVLSTLFSTRPELARLEFPTPLGPASLGRHGIHTIPTLGGTVAPGVRFMSRLRVRNGGRIGNVLFEVQIGQNHLPAVQPRYRVIAVDQDGNVLPLRAADSTTDRDGFMRQTSPDAATYYNGNAPYAITYACNQNRVVDLSKYAYFVEVIDESGASSWTTTGNAFMWAQATHDQITLLDGQA